MITRQYPSWTQRNVIRRIKPKNIIFCERKTWFGLRASISYFTHKMYCFQFIHLHIWVELLSTENISHITLKSTFYIHRRFHAIISILPILYKDNFTRDTWVCKVSPPWCWMFRSSVWKFHTINVRKQKLRKSCSFVDLLDKSLPLTFVTLLVCSSKKNTDYHDNRYVYISCLSLININRQWTSNVKLNPPESFFGSYFGFIKISRIKRNQLL